MRCDVHHYVNFRADFSRPESTDEPSGQELAAILIDTLRMDCIAVTRCKGVDFAYYIDCDFGASTIGLMVGADIWDDRGDRWYVQPYRKQTFWGYESMQPSDLRAVLQSVDNALRRCPRISDVRWYPSFDMPQYLALMPYAEGPIPEPDYGSNPHPLIGFYWRLDQIQGMITSPVTAIGFFVIACAVTIIAPEPGVIVITVLFFAILALMTVVPIVLSILVFREAQRRAHKAGNNRVHRRTRAERFGR